MLEQLGNVILLERPIHGETLLRAVSSALRGRRRQYETRSHLEELKEAEERLTQLNATLEARILQRTAELSRANDQLMQEITERERAQQRFTMDRPLEHDDIAELLQHLRRLRRAAAGALGGKQDKREVGPGRLACEPGDEPFPTRVHQRFLGEQSGARASGELLGKLGHAGADATCMALPGEELVDDLCVPASQRQEQNPFFHRLALGCGRLSRQQGSGAAIGGSAGQHAFEILERLADLDSA